MTVAVLQDAGRIALAKALAAMPAHFAWGRGDGAWGAPPAVPSDRTALLNEVGRRLATTVRFVLPAAAADYDVEIGQGAEKKYYKFSADPTPWLYLRAEFSTDDALGEDIRECGLFFGTQAKADVPAGLRYLTPAQLQDPGFIYHLTFRSKNTREGQKANEEAVLPL